MALVSIPACIINFLNFDDDNNNNNFGKFNFSTLGNPK